MSEIVERVSKRLWIITYGPAGRSFPENATEDARVQYRKWARDVIADMREPTEAMKDAGYAVDEAQQARATAPEHYRAMIDEALKE